MIHKLEEKIKGKGEVSEFDFTRVFENDYMYVYESSYKESKIHYEYFYKKTVPVCIDFAARKYSETDKKEIYPKSKDFGIWAWNTTDIEKAKNLPPMKAENEETDDLTEEDYKFLREGGFNKPFICKPEQYPSEETLETDK